ncbi:MAG: hypothetical protein AAF799_04170 [Myxococcota bacterium]
MLRPLHDRVVRAYLQAKDECRPHLFPLAFAEDAVFVSRFDFETDFGNDTPREGIEAITETFRALGQQCENIYTLCIPETVESTATTMSCKWIVGMTERGSREVRVAWGDYQWRFDPARDRATSLQVTMHRMAMMKPEAAGAVLGWLSAIEGPWCSAATLLEHVPARPQLEGVARYFA